MGKFAVALITIALIIFYTIILFTQGYLGMILTFLIVAAIGVALLLVARFAVRLERKVALMGVGTRFALRSAEQAIWAAEDHLVGFPSGTFVPERGDVPDTLIAKEFVPKGSGEIVKAFVLIPRNIAVGIFMVFAAFGWVGGLIGFFLAAIALGLFLFFCVVPLTLAWLVEIAMKPVVRSEIKVVAEEIDGGVELTFTFSGASALLLVKKVMGAFAPPTLPARYSGLVGAPSTVAPAPVPQSSAV